MNEEVGGFESEWTEAAEEIVQSKTDLGNGTAGGASAATGPCLTDCVWGERGDTDAFCQKNAGFVIKKKATMQTGPVKQHH